MDFTLPQLIDMTSHSAPTTALTPELAHEIMRLHRKCTTDSCSRKLAAFAALIAAGRIVPDSSRRFPTRKDPSTSNFHESS
ncbi:hypothetical protein H0264_38165 [Nocardia huaxiensis]|uniref:Uncharacterized protein n=1 Tax=Nocardia huaxiensis TaxID=2755382 RepID=A0A7D6V9D2_9NOCA|nr:hypothetical protein [Nocardia huaxiensis]QLY30841.1 hypothetical protein H0264_38165 [Nocardia huaxiensis]